MSCCYNSWDGPTLFSAKDVVARKQHTCCECGRAIAAGDLYETAKGLWDLGWATYKTCERCTDIRESVSGTVCTNFGELYDAYEYLVGSEVADRVFGRKNEGEEA